MGTIYMKADLSDINIENINNFDFLSVEYSEIQKLLKIEGMRNKIVKVNLNRDTQYQIHQLNGLTLDECMSIIENSDHIWDEIGRLHDFTDDFLLKNGDKLSYINIEWQKNITPEFVKLYRENLSIRRIFESREKIGDLHLFLTNHDDLKYYIKKNITWRSTKEQILSIIDNNNFSEEIVNNVVQMVNTWYNTPININKLLNDYADQNRAEYTESVVRNYWNSHSRKQEYINWNEYIEECKISSYDGLADTWFRSFMHKPMLEILGYNED